MHFYCQILRYIGLTPNKPSLSLLNINIYHYITTNSKLNTQLNDIRIIALKNISVIHFKLKNYPQCIDKCNIILSLNDKDIKSLFRRGISYKNINKINASIKDLKQAVNIKPSKEIKNELNKVLLLKNGNNNNAKFVNNKQEQLNIHKVCRNTDQSTKFGVKQSSMYQLTKIPFKGYGLITKCKIKKGTIILAEKPILIFNATNEITRNSIENQLDKASQSDHDIFKSLSHSKCINNSYNNIIVDIVQQNGIQMTDEKSGIFPTCARINHSCKPNIFWYWNKQQQCECIVASRDIHKNEELLVNYVSMMKYPTRNKRREHLIKHYGFYCECNQCNNIQMEKVKEMDLMNVKYQSMKETYLNAKGVGINKKLQQNMQLIKICQEHYDGCDCWLFYAERMQIYLHSRLKKYELAYDCIMNAVKYYVVYHGIIEKVQFDQYIAKSDLAAMIERNKNKFPAKYQQKICKFLNRTISVDTLIDNM